MCADYWAFPVASFGPAVISRIGNKLGDHFYEDTPRRSDSLLFDIPYSKRDVRDQCPMGSRSHFRRLEYACELDAKSGSKWPSGHRDIPAFQYNRSLDFCGHRSQQHHFSPQASNPYTITASLGTTLTISGVAITNNSGLTQNLATVSGGEIRFRNNATAGSNLSISNDGGTTNFFDRSTAGSAGIFLQDAGTRFFDHSTAGNCTIEASDSLVAFGDRSSAGSATLFMFDTSLLSFTDHSSAGSAFIGSGLEVDFSDSSTAGNATLGISGLLVFAGNSRGGTAQIHLEENLTSGLFGFLDISNHNAPSVTIGSLADDTTLPGVVFLGANNLTVGSNNLSTTFHGVIEEGVLGAGGCRASQRLPPGGW